MACVTWKLWYTGCDTWRTVVVGQEPVVGSSSRRRCRSNPIFSQNPSSRELHPPEALKLTRFDPSLYSAQSCSVLNPRLQYPLSPPLKRPQCC